MPSPAQTQNMIDDSLHVFDVKRFGARPGSRTDNKARIQYAINEAYSAGGGKVMVPGTDTPFVVDGSLMLREGVELASVGRGSAGLKLAPSASLDSITNVNGEVSHWAAMVPFIYVEQGGSKKKYVAIRDLKIDCNGANQGNTGVHAGIWVDNVDGMEVENVECFDAWPVIDYAGQGSNRSFTLCTSRCDNVRILGGWYNNAGYDCIGMRTGSSNTRFEGVWAGSAPKGAIQVTPGCDRTWIVNCTLDNRDREETTSSGLFIHGATRVFCIGTDLLSSGGNPFLAFGDSNDTASDIVVANCNLWVDSGAAFKLYSNYIKRVLAIGNRMYKEGTGNSVDIDDVIGDIAIRGGFIQHNTTSTAIQIDQSGETPTKRVQIQGVHIEALQSNNNQVIKMTNVDYANVCDNYIDVTGTGGLKIWVNGDNARITGNTLVGSGHGIRIDDEYSNAYVVGNDLTGNGASNDIQLCAPISSIVKDNLGAPTTAILTGTMPNDGTSVAITHGLSIPDDWTLATKHFHVQLLGDPNGGGAFWISAVSSTTVTVTCENQPTATVALAVHADFSRG